MSFLLPIYVRSRHVFPFAHLCPVAGRWPFIWNVRLRAPRSTHTDSVVASIFVNPTQFAAHEDLDTYPVSVERDLELMKERGVAAVLVPEQGSMYTEDHTTFVDPGKDYTGSTESEVGCPHTDRAHSFARRDGWRTADRRARQPTAM